MDQIPGHSLLLPVMNTYKINLKTEECVDKQQLIKELIEFIINTLDLEDEIEPEDIDPGRPLFAEELGLTSIDMLELTVGLEKKYKIKIGDMETAKTAFSSISNLADFILQNAS